MKLSSESHSNCHHCPHFSNNIRVYLTMARMRTSESMWTDSVSTSWVKRNLSSSRTTVVNLHPRSSTSTLFHTPHISHVRPPYRQSSNSLSHPCSLKQSMICCNFVVQIQGLQCMIFFPKSEMDSLVS